MLNVKKILFPTDFSECAESAFSHAAYLADRHNAELHVLHVTEGSDTTLAGRLGELRITPDEIAEQLHLPTAANGSAGADEPVPLVDVEEHGERAAPIILHYAETHGIDLIVMGTHGRRGIRRFTLGSVAEEVLRLALCPVFTARHREDRSVWAVNRILAPTDLSRNAQQATRHAAALAETYGAKLDLLLVIDPASIPTTSMPPMGTFELSAESVLLRANEALTQAAFPLNEEFNLPSEAGCHVRIGHPARDILEFVEENDTDLLVMSSHGRSGISRLLFGSVAEQVIRNASCPVFTVKSFGRSLLDAAPALEDVEAVPA